MREKVGGNILVKKWREINSEVYNRKEMCVMPRLSFSYLGKILENIIRGVK